MTHGLRSFVPAWEQGRDPPTRVAAAGGLAAAAGAAIGAQIQLAAEGSARCESHP